MGLRPTSSPIRRVKWVAEHRANPDGRKPRKPELPPARTTELLGGNMKINEWLLIWLALGAYGVICAIGGNGWCAGVAMACGYMAGRNVKQPLQPNA